MKIDFRVIPVLCILYLLAFLDRVNIANAAVYGLKTDLKLTTDQYNIALVIFFVPYVIFEIPSNQLLKHFRPHVWLPGCMFLFGVVTCLQGTVKSFSGLLATRFFLGMCESNIFPGCFYLIAMWYKREEAQKRFSFFFSSTTLAGAFGGLLAAAISNMEGIGGYKAWRWVFILEGLLTCVVSAILFFGISDFPEETQWLSDEEKAFVKQRLYEDVGESNHQAKHSFKDVLGVFKDWKIIAGGFMYFGLIVPAYSYAYFSPAIIQGLGHSPVKTQLYSVPPWVVAFGFAMIIATFSDKLRHRYAFVLIPIVLALVGYIILLTVHHRTHLQYGALFLAAAGNYAAMPVIVCWFNSNLAGHLRRSVGTAWQVGFGNIGGIIAAFSFLATDAPKYTPGYSLCIAFICLSALASTIYFVGVITENMRRDRGNVKGADLPEGEKALMGDLSPYYRYML